MIPLGSAAASEEGATAMAPMVKTDMMAKAEITRLNP
jgi:hypothetical protein